MQIKQRQHEKSIWSWTSQWMLRTTRSSFAEKDGEVLVVPKLNISQQCAFAAKVVHKLLGCRRNTTASVPRQVIHLLSTDKPALGFPVQEHWSKSSSPWMWWKAWHVTQRERLSRLVLSSWEKRWLRPKCLKTLDRSMKRRQNQTLPGCIQ